MKNYIQPGDTITLPAPYALASGDGALVGKIFGVSAGDAALGADFDSVTRGVFTLAKVPANVFNLGDATYWDNAARKVTSVSAGNPLIGACVAAAAAGSTTISVRLNGSFS